MVQYIFNDSEYYASNFARKLLLFIEKLKIFPHSGRIVPEYNNPDIRELIYQNYRIVYTIRDKAENYRIVYTIRDKAVYIVLVIHGTKNLPEII